ncbi:hypothetical protein ACMZOO_18970 (plasmid) [Catenovulum sp. SX2]|uniref:hypothetical protein n=1 Tax=Catenovulum sp. SX2 TaxID=3398614 RepID=UPI003F86D793
MKRAITRRSFDSIGKEPVVADTTRRRFKNNKSTTTVLNNVLFNPLNSRIATSLIRRVNDSVVSKYNLDAISQQQAIDSLDTWVSEVPQNEVLSFIEGHSSEDYSAFGVDRSLVQDIRVLYPLTENEGVFVGKGFALVNIADEKLNEIASSFLESVFRVAENINAGALLQDKIKTMHIRGQKYLITGGGHRRAVALGYVDGWQSSQDIEVEVTAETSLLDLYTENNSKESETKFERLLAQHRLYIFLKDKNTSADDMRAKLQLSRSWYFKLIKILKRPAVIDLIKSNPAILDSVGLETISKLIDGLAEYESDEARFINALEQALNEYGSSNNSEEDKVSHETKTSSSKIDAVAYSKSVKTTNKMLSKIVKEPASFTGLFKLIFPETEHEQIEPEKQHQMLHEKLKSIMTDA